MIFINLTRKIARWACSSVRGSNEASKPMRIKKIHSHLIIQDVKSYKWVKMRRNGIVWVDKYIGYKQ